MKKVLFIIFFLCMLACAEAQVSVRDFYAKPNPVMSGETFTFHATVVNETDAEVDTQIFLRGMSDPEKGFYGLGEFKVAYCDVKLDAGASKKITYDYSIVTEDEYFSFFFRDMDGRIISPYYTVQIGMCGEEVERIEILGLGTYVFVDSVQSELAAVYPGSAPQDVEWSIGDESLAEIVGYYNDGPCSGVFFKGLSPGETTLTAMAVNGMKATIPLTVYKNPKGAESLTLNITEYAGKVGDTFQLIATVEPEDVDDLQVYFISRDEKVAKVGMFDGLVELVGTGSTEILSWVWPGSAGATCQVTSGPAALADIAAEELADVFGIDGIIILRQATSNAIRTLPSGYYIVRYPDRTKKITISNSY